MSLLARILPRVLAVRAIANASPELLRAYGADTLRHRSLGLITCDQDDSTYVALDEATKHAEVDVVFARSFYAGSSHSSGKLSGEILGVLAAADPDILAVGLAHALRTLEHDACFYDADGRGTVTVFPHVIASLGHYLSRETGIAAGEPLAYLVAPPLEATLGFDRAIKSADVRVVRISPPPTETNFACALLTGALDQCEAAATAFIESVVETARNPFSVGPHVG